MTKDISTNKNTFLEAIHIFSFTDWLKIHLVGYKRGNTLECSIFKFLSFLTLIMKLNGMINS